MVTILLTQIFKQALISQFESLNSEINLEKMFQLTFPASKLSSLITCFGVTWNQGQLKVDIQCHGRVSLVSRQLEPMPSDSFSARDIGDEGKEH